MTMFFYKIILNYLQQFTWQSTNLQEVNIKTLQFSTEVTRSCSLIWWKKIEMKYCEWFCKCFFYIYSTWPFTYVDYSITIIYIFITMTVYQYIVTLVSICTCEWVLAAKSESFDSALFSKITVYIYFTNAICFACPFFWAVETEIFNAIHSPLSTLK